MAMISNSFRSRVRAGVEQPVARVFGRLGLTPNVLTLIGLAIAVVAAYFAATQAWLIAGLLVAFGAVFDLFDGALARATGKTSRFGAFLDSTMDRAAEAVVYLGLLLAGLTSELQPLAVGAGAAMAASFLVSYTRARSESLGFSPGNRMASVGLAPREVRSVILVLGLIVAGLGPAYVAPAVNEVCADWCVPFGVTVLMMALAVVAILATITTIQRMLFVYRQSKSQEESH